MLRWSPRLLGCVRTFGAVRCLTDVAAGGGAMERAEALASLVSTARSYWIRRSFYEAGFVKNQMLGSAMLHGRESGRWGSRLLERERRTDLPALGADRRLLLLSVSTSATSIT